jgi:hypothetical protein
MDNKGNAPDVCPRTVAIYRPGEALPGVSHHYAYSGRVPCTGVLRCTLCGQRPPLKVAP